MNVAVGFIRRFIMCDKSLKYFGTSRTATNSEMNNLKKDKRRNMKKIIFLTAVLITCFVVSAWAENKSKPVKSEPVPIQNIAPKEKATPTAYEIPWTSINAGGSITLASTNYSMRVSTAQSVIGESQSANYKMGIGFWYGVPAGPVCTDKAGDVNGSGTWTLTDIVGLVNIVFKGATKPTPLCRADANGTGGNPTITDVIYLVNKVFKGGPNPVPTGVCCL